MTIRAAMLKRTARSRSGLLLAAAALACLGLLLRGDSATRSGGSEAFFGLKQMNVSKVVREDFPGAMKGSEVMARVMRAIRPYNVKRRNTIYGQSICSDEINGDKGHFPVLMAKHFGHVFPLGGIGGAPYVGKTGFMAFSHHVPEDGHVVVVFGPHIGYSMDGQPGKFLRRGQDSLSTSCGAVIAAHSQVSTGSMAADPQDAQQSWLRSKLKGSWRKVSRSENPMVDLAMEAYRAVEKEMLSIVNTNYGSGNLVLIGGVQINMPYPMNGFFMPLHFSVRSEGQSPVDLMSAFE